VTPVMRAVLPEPAVAFPLSLLIDVIPQAGRCGHERKRAERAERADTDVRPTARTDVGTAAAARGPGLRRRPPGPGRLGRGPPAGGRGLRGGHQEPGAAGPARRGPHARLPCERAP